MSEQPRDATGRTARTGANCVHAVPPTQPPAAPETDVRLTEAERGALADAAATLGTDDYPGLLFDEVECIVAERVRVVEGERDAEVAEVEHEHEKTLAIMEAACDRSDAATLRAESAEAAHEAEKAAHEEAREVIADLTASRDRAERRHERLESAVEALADEYETAAGAAVKGGTNLADRELKFALNVIDDLRSLLGGGEAR